MARTARAAGITTTAGPGSTSIATPARSRVPPKMATRHFLSMIMKLRFFAVRWDHAMGQAGEGRAYELGWRTMRGGGIRLEVRITGGAEGRLPPGPDKARRIM